VQHGLFNGIWIAISFNAKFTSWFKKLTNANKVGHDIDFTGKYGSEKNGVSSPARLPTTCVYRVHLNEFVISQTEHLEVSLVGQAKTVKLFPTKRQLSLQTLRQVRENDH
jgi:hypothetical protein